MQEGNDPIHTCLLSVKSAMMSTGGFSKGSFIQQNMEVILTFATGMERCVFGQGICVCVFFLVQLHEMKYFWLQFPASSSPSSRLAS